MQTPLDTSSFNVDTRQRKISFLYPLKQVSLFNKGPEDVKVRFGNSGFHTIKKHSSLDLEFPNGITKFYAVTDSGSSTLDFVGVRRYIENKPNKIQKIPLEQVYVIPLQETNQTNINTLPYLILLAILALVAIVAIVSLCKKGD